MYSDDVLVRLGVDKKQFERDMRGIPALVERALTPLYRAFLKTTEALNSLGRAAGKAFGKLDQALGKFGVSLSAAAAFAWVKNLVRQTDALKDTADSLGVNVEWLQRMQFAADRNGSSADYLSEKLMKLNQVIGDAIENGGPAAEAFTKWKISLTNADGTAKNTQQVLGDIADRMKDARDATQQAAIANDFFGRGTSRLIPLLKEGADALKAMGAGAVIMSEEAIEKVARLNDGFMAVKNTINSIAVEAFNWLDKTIGALPRLFGAMSGGAGFWDSIDASANQRDVKNPSATSALPGATYAQVKAIADAKKELDAALKASRLDNMTEAEKLNELEREREEIDKRLLKMSKEQVNGADGMRALTELVKKDHEIAQHKLKVEKEISDEKKKQTELSRQLFEADRDHGNALIDAQNKERDRRLYTFDDLAQGRVSRSNTPLVNANILGAKRAAFLDDYARRAENSGRPDIARRVQGVADQIRASLGLLKYDERMPFMQINEQLQKSREAIERIETAITNLGKE